MKFSDLVNAANLDGAMPSANVYAVDQFGATKSPVTDVRLDSNGDVVLDIEVETD